MIDNPTNMRTERGADSWFVREDMDEFGVPPCESNNHGYLADGFQDEAHAQEWIKNELLERQCREWENHIRQDEDDEPMPW